MKRFCSITACIIFWGLVPNSVSSAGSKIDYPADQILAKVLASDNPNIARVVQRAEHHELQILFTPLLSNDHFLPGDSAQFGKIGSEYFYPASTAKLPVALLAAERISEDSRIGLNTKYTMGDATQRHTVANDIELIFAISDNEAFNRLYDWLGRDWINQRLFELGYRETQIVHRLAVSDASRPERQKFNFYASNSDEPIVFDGVDSINHEPLKLAGRVKGIAHIDNGQRVELGFDFLSKNSFALSDQHLMLQRLYLGIPDYELSEPAADFIKTAMANVPQDIGIADPEYYDSYVKFFVFGDQREPIDSPVKIHNKVGYAYGTLTDNAYIVDQESSVAFFLSATLLVNENGVFNDDTYEYDEVGIPFLAELGRQILQQMNEIKRAAQQSN